MIVTDGQGADRPGGGVGRAIDRAWTEVLAQVIEPILAKGRLWWLWLGREPVWIWRWLARPKTIALVEACTIGLVAGLAAVALKVASATLGGQRLALAHHSGLGSGGLAIVLLPAIGAVGCWLAGWLIQETAPETSGSGIPQVKAALAFGPIPLDGRVALVKGVATSLALGSGLTLGRQGPTVQLGAAIAAQLSRWIPTSPDYRRQMIAAGAAAGLAAGFNAPIAGVLFVVEELLRDVSGLTLGPALLASFVGAVVARSLGGGILPVNLNQAGATTLFLARDIPAYLLLGLLAGWLGANFNRGLLASQRLYGRLACGLPGRLAIAGAVTGLVVALLPERFWNHSWLREELIVGELGWQWTAISLLTHGFLTLVAFGSGAPGGLFSPSLILGAALGALVGFATGSESIATYALAGMGAFFAAVSRVPITAIAIVFEMTTDFHLVLPLMVASATAYLVADRLDPGSLYDRLLLRLGIDPEPAAAEDLLADLTAKDVMHKPVETLAASLSLADVRRYFGRSHHRGFPVVDDGHLVGIITESDLTHLDPRQANQVLREVMTPAPLTAQIDDSLADVRFLFSRYRLSRLPVLEGRRLVGIVTRSDLLRAESQRLGGESQTHNLPLSYGIYKRRGPNIGRERFLVPLANPETAGGVLRLALALACDRRAEIECLQILTVPSDRQPGEVEIPIDQLEASRTFLDGAVALGHEWHVPIHAQIRVSHEVAPAILETIGSRRINLLLMGWQGESATADRLLGSTLDHLVRAAPCLTLLIRCGVGWSESGRRWGHHTGPFCALAAEPLWLPPALDRWLVPISGGPNIQIALSLLPALVSTAKPAVITLCQVFAPDLEREDNHDTTLDQAYATVIGQLTPDRQEWQVEAVRLCARSIADAIVDLATARRCNAILMGASQDSLLRSVLTGNLPEAIARQYSGTIILVRAGQIDS